VELWTAAIEGADFEASPAVAGGVIYEGSVPNGTLYAFGAGGGVQLWSMSLGSYVFSSAAVVDGVVYVVSIEFDRVSHLYAFGL
jgi:outer membrane protein assembly factor BamB